MELQILDETLKSQIGLATEKALELPP